MAGRKGKSGGWNKREEIDWTELVQENKTILLNLAKRFRISADTFSDKNIEMIMSDPDKRKLFFKSLDIATAVVVKSMPTKVGSDGTLPDSVISVAIVQGNPDGNNVQVTRGAVPHIR